LSREAVVDEIDAACNPAAGLAGMPVSVDGEIDTLSAKQGCKAGCDGLETRTSAALPL
jgi:hypothetical protein